MDSKVIERATPKRNDVYMKAEEKVPLSFKFIKDEFKFVKNIGVTRYGVVKLAQRISNPDESVIIKLIDTKRLK